jgi:hypothetical protein
MKALKWAFLGGVSIPPGLDEDNRSVMAVAAMMADEHDRTFKIVSRWVDSVNIGTTLDLLELGVTNTRLGC